MKKILTLIASFAALLVLVPAVASAAPKPPVFTNVYGTVTNNSKPVNNAKVTVICDGNVQKTTTDNTGYYSVAFKATKCPIGSPVTVTVTKGSKGGENGGTVSKYSDDLNVSLVNVALPELGIVTGISAAVVATGAFFVIRRRQLGQN